MASHVSVLPSMSVDCSGVGTLLAHLHMFPCLIWLSGLHQLFVSLLCCLHAPASAQAAGLTNTSVRTGVAYTLSSESNLRPADSHLNGLGRLLYHAGTLVVGVWLEAL